jgi:hypothetical protein
MFAQAVRQQEAARAAAVVTGGDGDGDAGPSGSAGTGASSSAEAGPSTSGGVGPSSGGVATTLGELDAAVFDEDSDDGDEILDDDDDDDDLDPAELEALEAQLQGAKV